ncbi:MAG: hypothetical protein KAT34_11525 [Candidatus Aminicenantes bacterium]|nr:hypothetical protein [Candidatus Aminicenantes bacterium]
MKKLILLIVVCLAGFLFPGLTQEQKEKIREEVSVTNVEVPVRVFYKGKAVGDLTRKDFKLYENKRLQTINGFYLKKRKIKIDDIRLSTGEPEPEPEPEKKSPPPRFFVLVFRVTNYTEKMKKGVAYLIENVLRDNDQLLVFVNDKTIFLNKGHRKVKRKDILDQVIREESIKANQRLVSYFIKIQRALNMARTELKLQDDQGRRVAVIARPDILVNFLEDYLASWVEYKKKYLLPDIDKYYNFANFLEKIDKEKWVISFYQIEMFPKMKYSGELRQQIELIMSELLVGRSEDIVYSRQMLSLLTEIDRELNVADDFHSDEISKLFFKVDATCHSIFCGVQKDSMSQDLEFKRISTDIENSLREMTANTGGALIASNDLESALRTISEKEDIYYMLTYAPDDPRETGKIKVEVSDKKYDVVYDSNMRADYIKEYLEKKRALSPTILLDDISFKEKKLRMEISNFLMQKTEEGRKGKISVQVRIKDEADRLVFDKNRFLVTDKKVTTITIDFDWLKKGNYNIIVDVSDMLSGKTAMEFLQPTVE